MSICGLDFGTSNTTLGTIADGEPILTALEGDHTTIPSAIFYGGGGSVVIGRKAIATYVEGMPGRLTGLATTRIQECILDCRRRVIRDDAG